MRNALRAAPTWVAALLWGAFVPAVLFAAAARSPALLPIALGITLLHALAALPIALFFRWRGWLHFAVVAAAGFVIGALPMGLLIWPDELSRIGHVLMVDAGFGLLGASGASTFWAILRVCGALSPVSPEMARLGPMLALLGLCAFVGCFVFL